MDCKSVIHELSWIIDKKNVLWIMRIGQTLGRQKPEGQLLDFLGSDVVSAIWNAYQLFKTINNLFFKMLRPIF